MPINYSQGKIYVIRSPNMPQVYIGSTTMSLQKRFTQHKSATNKCSSKAVIDAGDATIEQVEACPCETRDHLNRREGEVMRGTANCINQKIQVQPQALTNTRGYIVYIDDDFFLVVSERSKKTHKIARDSNTIPATVMIDEKELQLSHVPITDSRLFSACREYIYDRERRSPNYY